MSAHTQVEALPNVPGLGLVAFSADGSIERADVNFAAALERPLETLVKENYWHLTAPGQKQHELNQLLSGPEPFEKEYLLADGRQVTFRLFGGVYGQGADQVFYAYTYRIPENSRNSESTERILRHQNAILLSLNQNEAIDAGDIDRALQAITEAGTAGLRCERSSVWLYADNETKIEMLDLYQQTERQHSNGFTLYAKDFPGYFQALAEDRTIAANDAHTHPATREFSEVYLKPLNISSMLEAPIRLNGKLLGVLCTENVGPMKTFTQEEQNFAANVADFIGRALQAKARRQYEEALRETNANLENLVEARTASLQLVLDSMGDALLVANLDGRLTGEKSRITTTWFGPLASGELLWNYLAPDNGNFKESLHLGFEEMVEGYLPFEITSAQAPKTLVRGGRTYRLSYRQVLEKGAFAKLVVVLSDVTEELIRQQAEQATRELPQIINSLLWNTEGFRAFIEETETLLSELTKGTLPLELAKRHLHTLKGTTAIQGFVSYSQHVHELENQVAELGTSALSVAALGELSDAFHRALAPISSILDQKASDVLSVLPEEHRDLISSIKRETSYEELLNLVAGWRLPRTDSLLAPLAGQGKRIAERLDKRVEIELKPTNTRLPSPELRPFFSSLVHVFRNALDHGIETPEERRSQGKPEVGKVALSAYVSNSRFVVEVRDDGRGINWELIRQRAEAQGLPASSQSDLERALFTDGLSTRDEVTTLSGRGVGLSATLEACHQAGGQCLIETASGHGTTFRFVFAVPEKIAIAAE